MHTSDRQLLVAALQVSVPLLIEQARQTQQGFGDLALGEQVERWRTEALDQVAHHGDVLQWRSRTGETARAFNGLAQAVAALALQPGGVRFAGVLWCASHCVGGRTTTDRVCPECEEVDA